MRGLTAGVPDAPPYFPLLRPVRSGPTGRGGCKVALPPTRSATLSKVPACVCAPNDVTEGRSKSVRLRARLSFFPGRLLTPWGFHSTVCGTWERTGFLVAGGQPVGLPAPPEPAAEMQAQCLGAERFFLSLV